MIPLDKGPYLRSLSQSPTTLTLVLLQAVSVEIKVSQTAWRAPHFFYDTLYTLVHAFRGPSDKGLRSKLAETKQKPRRFSNGNWIGGKVEGELINNLSSSFKRLNSWPALAREQPIPFAPAVSLWSWRKPSFWSRPRSFVSLTGLLLTAYKACTSTGTYSSSILNSIWLALYFCIWIF